MSQKKDQLCVMYEGWKNLVHEKQEFKSEWDQFVEETRRVSHRAEVFAVMHV